MFISIAWAFKDDAHVQEMSTWQKRLSKSEFLKLSKGARERYLKLYPHSSHRFLMHKGDPDNVENEQKKKEAPKTGAARFKEEDDIFEKRRKHAALRKDISEFNKSNVAVVNPSSLSALQEIKTDHLREAADGVGRNKKEIALAVQNQAKKQPHMFNRGLGAVRTLISGEQKPDELSTTTKHALHKVLGSIATMAVLGAGVLAVGAAAGPLGVVLGVTMFNMWAGSKHGKNLRDDISELRRLREKKRQADRKKEEEEFLAKHGYTATAYSVFDPMDDDSMSDEHVIGVILDQVKDLMQHQTAADLQEHGSELFATACSDAYAELQYLLNFGYCANYRQQGEGMLFNCPGGFKGLVRLFRNMGYEISNSEDGDNHVYHFDNGYARATVGQIGDDFYLRGEGDFHYVNGLREVNNADVPV